MRWLLQKDLRILRRSPFLVTLLVVYPVVVALLIGLALSRGPEKPRVAFLNQVPATGSTVELGGDKIDLSKYSNRFFQSVDPIRVHTRQEAIDKVRSGDALAALVIPPDIVDRLASGVQQAQVEVIYNGDALKQSFVQSTIDSKLAEANSALAAKVKDAAVADVQLLVDGGHLATPLGQFDLLGLSTSKDILDATIASLPQGSAQRAALQRVADFAGQARIGLNFARGGLTTISEPVQVKRTIIGGKRTPLDTFAAAIAVTLSLTFVCVLLAAGMLALEREEQAFSRLVRGLVSRTGLLVEKLTLAAVCGVVVAVLMVAVSALAFGALGVAVGGLAREVRAASLLAILVTLPLAFLALVPGGAVSTGLYDLVRVVSALFPFKPALQAIDAAVNNASPPLGGSLLHLLALTAAFLAIARLALRRFG